MQEYRQKSIIQPSKLANKGGEIRFNWQVKEFARLGGILYSDTGNIKVHIRGACDHRRRCLLETEIKADLTLECQTSFEPIDYVVDCKVTYCTVVSESQFAEVEEEYEPVLIEDGQLDIKRVIEDELILSVPIVANKSADELTQKMSFGELDEKAITESDKANNPFSVLSNLKKK